MYSSLPFNLLIMHYQAILYVLKNEGIQYKDKHDVLLDLISSTHSEVTDLEKLLEPIFIAINEHPSFIEQFADEVEEDDE
ncbi:hypothetical protein [Lysinibacillus fusiformis]|uniref:hypothetical protein n=1 Tax=Lysinibacillus fusiformis TaxID=28031 RepID=UPI003717B330